MSKECDLCGGNGLVGSGAEPSKQEGITSTCAKCAGKGKLEVEE